MRSAITSLQYVSTPNFECWYRKTIVTSIIYWMGVPSLALCFGLVVYTVVYYWSFSVGMVSKLSFIFQHVLQSTNTYNVEWSYCAMCMSMEQLIWLFWRKSKHYIFLPYSITYDIHTIYCTYIQYSRDHVHKHKLLLLCYLTIYYTKMLLKL